MEHKSQMLWAKFIIFLAMLITDILMFKFLVDNVFVVAQGEVVVDSAVAAIIANLVGVITTVLAMASRDFFNGNR